MQEFETVCMRIAIQAGIADTLLDHDDGLHVDKLAEKAGLEPTKLSRILRLLATRNCFREGETYSRQAFHQTNVSSCSSTGRLCKQSFIANPGPLSHIRLPTSYDRHDLRCRTSSTQCITGSRIWALKGALKVFVYVSHKR